MAEKFRLMRERIGVAEARQVSGVEAARLIIQGADHPCIEDSLIATVAGRPFSCTALGLDDPLLLEPNWNFDPSPDADPPLGVATPRLPAP